MAEVTLRHFQGPESEEQAKTFQDELAISSAIATGRVVYGIDDPLGIMRDYISVGTIPIDQSASSSDGQGVESRVDVESYEIKEEMRNSGIWLRTSRRRKRFIEGWASGIHAETLELLEGGAERFAEETQGGRYIVWVTSVADSGWTHPDSKEPLLEKTEDGLYVFNRKQQESEVLEA